MKKPKSQAAPNQLHKFKQSVIHDCRQHLKIHKSEVLKMKIIERNAQIGGELFDDFLGDRILLYMPIDLKDILNLCLGEPNIVAEVARFTSSEPSTLTIIKDAIHFYLKDWVYRQMPELINQLSS